MPLEKEIYGEDAMTAFGAALSIGLKSGGVVYLDGDLGMGKTTLVRGVLRGLGYEGPVKSPTYTLVEPYEFGDFEVFHFDLYRLKDPEELEYMGIRDYFTAQGLCLIEWAEMGDGVLPEPDLVVSLNRVTDGRCVSIAAHSQTGEKALAMIKGTIPA
ncbi:tRNA (adenosine(37)-N6)-threonylcarbamoyltransferase complex ATPase subunit type 1 TsaE [Marinomonas sp. A79]|uniref:tRNA threonylcarbamoyladenosine biosynthesis protein TsaE n=1 Tax=Marinomonas vulgaris TaxID=2823372 RepID=A0ABS5HFD2_9GAMM|nr:tRNA (adenosine(37)-N6)-threonylcarbamoyltransferase complex ATPase subunit type 1 TsaE [Marinomonas vulgaris]MBR7889739.1 tRNA (adenosine(37)-N6)-threonylcarbamoyltransferase complex ATPase subunit type 1 TsaE [Marinomonas vulgaris]